MLVVGKRAREGTNTVGPVVARSDGRTLAAPGALATLQRWDGATARDSVARALANGELYMGARPSGSDWLAALGGRMIMRLAADLR